MAKRARILMMIAVFSVSLLPSLLLLGFNDSNLLSFLSIKPVNQIDELSTLNYQKYNYTGNYDGNVSIICTWANQTTDVWSSQNSSTYFVQKNLTKNNYTYDLNYIEIYAHRFVNASYNQTIASNVTNRAFPSPALAFAQELTAPELMTIYEFSMVLHLPGFRQFRVEMTLLDESMQNTLDYNESWYYLPPPDADYWVPLGFSDNVLEPGKKYNMKFAIWFDDLNDYENTNRWKTTDFHNATIDNGTSRYFDGTNWHAIQNDSQKDFLCRYKYKSLINPADIDLKYYVEDQLVIPEIKTRPGIIGYFGYYSYNLEGPPDHEINVTITTNQTIDFQVDILPNFVYLLNVTGSYNTSRNRIEWEIKYPYKDISGTGGQAWDFFLFEYDWVLDGFYEADGSEFENLFLGHVKLYNQSYYGICDIFGIPYEQDTYTGIYHSSNFFGGVATQIKDNNVYHEVTSIQLGQTVRIQAEIKSPNNELISGGTGIIQLISPTGTIIYNGTSLTSVNGTLNSSDIEIGSNFDSGVYVINMFWTNGREIAYYSAYIEIKSEPSPPIFFPPNELPLWMLILLGGLIAAAAATPLGLVLRKKLRERDWEKSLRNLFILAKNGVSMYFHSFGIDITDPSLISGMISALTSFVQDAIGSKKQLRTIDQEDKKILLSHGKYTISALVAEKDLGIIHRHLDAFEEDFETTYQKFLKDWLGDVSIFKGVDRIIDKHFPVEMEDKIIRGVKAKIVEFTERILTIDKPAEVISIFREITEFSSKYQALINEHYSKEYNELLKIAEEKIQKE